ncbi:ubiquitin-protein ligase (E3), partial [Marasmius crinis-equi]
RRNERIEHKRRVDAAVHVQAWWRGCCERRRVREVLLGEIDSQLGVFNEGTVRRVCFVGVGGGGKDVLGRWSRAVVARNDGLGDLNDYLRRTLTRTLLNLVASGVNSEYCADHLALLTALKSPPPPNFYQLISKSLRETTKTSVSLPALITLLFSVPPNQRDLLIHILTIPLLPNRLPLQTLTALSSSLPLSQLGMNDVQGLATQLTMEDKVHLLSNLLAFTTPRYPKLPKKALSAYLNLIADLLDPFPPNAFDPEAAAAAAKSTIQDDEDDIQVRVVESFDAPPLPPPTLALPKIDAKTLKRIQGLVAPSHITSLMSATATATATSTEARSHLFRVVLGMIRVWPAKKESVVAGLWGGGGIVKDLWRGWVRSSGLGREVGDPSSSSSPYDVLVPQTGSQPKSRLVPQTLGAQQQDPWPALLLLCEIYTQVLGTMGDDEFFGAGTDGASSFSAAAPLTSTAIRNPLSLDDLRLLSRMVLNVVWVMYTSPPPPPPPLPTSTSTPTPTPTPTPLSSPNAWHETRVTLTTLLRALHARDARRAYVPEGHWIKLAGDDGGWDSFVEAALVEEERVLADTEEDPDRMDVDSEPSSYPYGGGGGGGGGGYGAGGVRVEYIGGDEGAGLGFDLDYPPPPRGGRYHHPHPRAQNQNQNSIRAKRAKERLAKHQRILEDIPFAVPFELRVIRRGSSSSSSFRSSSSSSSYVTQALATLTHPHLSMHNARYPGHARNRVEIRRTHISQDGFDKLGSEEIDFKDPIEIIFKDQWGQEEAGIDGGGLFKEFFTSLSKEVFDPQRGLWVETGGGGGGIGGGGGGVGGREEEGGGRELYPRAGKYQEERYSLEWYRFVGRVVGKALYDGILVDVVFARVCFVGVGGGGKDVLGRWSRAVVARNDGLGDLNDYLRRTLTRTLLNLVASGVNSEYCADHLALLTALKSPPPPNFYQLISRSLRETTKTSASLPALITLLFSVPPNQRDLLIHILTIPLLPNRLPLQTLTALSSSLPLSQLGMNDVQGLATQLTMEDKLHLLSNLLAFTTPRYPKLPKKALSAYLNLIADLLDPFPPNAFDPEAAAAAAKSTIQDDEDDIQVRVVESFDAPPLPPPTLALPKIDAKTLKRIQGLVAPSHITSLMSATATATSTEARSHLFRVVLGMIRVWPAKKESVVAGLWGGGGIVKDLWRGWVRSSGLGREVGDPSSSSSPYDVLVPQVGSRLVPQTLGAQQQDPWPALLLLCEIYTQVLGTMGDDEFFGAGTDGASSFSAAAPLTSTAIRNPLSLDDLRLLSRMVLNVVWVMYTSPPPPPPPPPTSTSTPTPTPTPTPLSSPNAWHETRVTLTTLLRALHARDARRAYVPEGHWIKLAGDDGGWDSFVEAALVEEERVLADTEEDPDRMDVDSEPSSYPYGGGGGGGYGAGGVRVEYIGGDEGAGLGFDLDYPPPPRGGRYHHHAHPHPRAQNQNSIRAKRAKERLAKHQRILEDIPFAVPFELRVRVFRGYVALDQVIRRGSSSSFRSSSSSSSYVTQALTTLTHPHLSMHNARYPGHARNRVEIRRTHISQDGFDKLGSGSEEIDFKDPIEIIFKDQWGQEEAGIDGGGLFKEFFTSLSKEVFDPQRGLWVETGGGGGMGLSGNGRDEEGGRELYPRAGKYQEERYSLEWYRFVGRVVGKALYDGILVDVVFARFFLARWLALGAGSSSGGGAGVSGGGAAAGRMTLLDDLRSLDEEVWRGLVFLKHLNPVGGEVEALGLRFCVDVEEFGQTTTHDLIPHGSLIPVTPQNRLQYISLLAHFKLIKQIRLQSHAFFSGVAQVIPARWVRMFTPSELSHLLGGSAGDVDVEDLRRHTKYGGLYVDGDGEGGDQRVRWFWEVVRGFSERERRGLLRFVTSCSRGPLLGFKELNPQFAIRDAGEDQDRLPTASTCVNLLKLPRYASRAVMRAKLLQAINSGAGFDLS